MGNAGGDKGAANEPTIPDKYVVKKADGSVDLELTSKKLAGGYGELDKRMKDVGLPPETPDKYEIAATDAANKDVVAEILADPLTKAFLKDAHAAGLSNKQANVVLNHYAGMIRSTLEADIGNTQEECIAALKTVAGSDAGVKQMLTVGKRAALTFGAATGIKFEEIEAAGLANNPLFCRIMAAVGKELPEDLPAPGEGAGEGGKTFEEQASELRNELQALQPHDPKRAGVQAKLDALYQRKYPQTKPILKGAA